MLENGANIDGEQLYNIADPRGEFESTVLTEQSMEQFKNKLTEQDKLILQLRYEGYSLKEIAEQVGFKSPSAVSKRIEKLLIEINHRLQFMHDVGLSYLTLNRQSNTLSGGESQRINLAKSLGSSLVGSLYVLDEPSIGLHPRDTELLIHVLQELRDLGNTIVVVEHDTDIIAAADHVIEIGPAAGRHGGEIVYEGKPRSEWFKIDIPTQRRHWNNYIEVEGACENNLKNLTVRFPLHVMTVVTGVSGSGSQAVERLHS